VVDWWFELVGGFQEMGVLLPLEVHFLRAVAEKLSLGV
jgi:hypothetical protein